ncbi:MAG: T9SS type A sorting domain-containing protein [Calditrichaeota bacterium]|nr:T9SS type A sorting domain-containing protein [Calditrichota bacterium]MCB9391765.1 T9SS type A sorting domain-containing protein [Calditrichota bacterium]
MMNRVHHSIVSFFLLCLCFAAQAATAAPWVIGYSGAPGTQSCASSCHGEGSGTVEIHGFPASYHPDSLYVIRLNSSGTSIKNFNASCRIGTGTLAAGVLIGSGTTASYTVPTEQNGIHLTQLDQDSAQFLWFAPPAGTGEVRLYVAAHQGHDTGPNNDLMLVAAEEVIPLPPDTPANPFPMDSSLNVPLDITLNWDEVARADSFRVFFGSSSNPPLVSSQVAIEYVPEQLQYNTTYHWRIEAVNSVGSTSGPEWIFHTVESAQASELTPFDFELRPAYPNPFNSSTQFELSLNSETDLAVRIFDVNGRATATLFHGRLSAGQHQLSWDASGVAAGIFFVKVSSKGLTHTQKLVYLP